MRQEKLGRKHEGERLGGRPGCSCARCERVDAERSPAPSRGQASRGQPPPSVPPTPLPIAGLFSHAPSPRIAGCALPVARSPRAPTAPLRPARTQDLRGPAASSLPALATRAQFPGAGVCEGATWGEQGRRSRAGGRGRGAEMRSGCSLVSRRGAKCRGLGIFPPFMVFCCLSSFCRWL